MRGVAAEEGAPAGEPIEGFLREALLHPLVRLLEPVDRFRARRDARLRRGERRLEVRLAEALLERALVPDRALDELAFLVRGEERIGDLVDLLRIRAGRLQRRRDRLVREARMLLHAAEPLLARREEHASVLDERGRRVLVEGGDSEDLQAVAEIVTVPRSFTLGGKQRSGRRIRWCEDYARTRAESSRRLRSRP